MLLRQLSFWLLLLVSAPASAAPISSLTELFVGGCLLPEARYDATVALAIASNWEHAPDEMLPLLMPSTKPLKMEAWVATEGDEIYLVAASLGVLDGVEVPSCVVAGDADFAEVEKAIFDLGGTLIEETNEVVQVSRYFQVERMGNRLLISLVTAPHETRGLMSASVTDAPD